MSSCQQRTETQLLRKYVPKALIDMVFKPQFLKNRYLDPLGQLNACDLASLVVHGCLTKRVRLECQYGIRSQKPCHICRLSPNSIMALPTCSMSLKAGRGLRKELRTRTSQRLQFSNSPCSLYGLYDSRPIFYQRVLILQYYRVFPAMLE